MFLMVFAQASTPSLSQRSKVTPGGPHTGVHVSKSATTRGLKIHVGSPACVPEVHVGSPEGQWVSPKVHVRSPEGQWVSPEVRVLSPQWVSRCSQGPYGIISRSAGVP